MVKYLEALKIRNNRKEGLDMVEFNLKRNAGDLRSFNILLWMGWILVLKDASREEVEVLSRMTSFPQELAWKKLLEPELMDLEKFEQAYAAFIKLLSVRAALGLAVLIEGKDQWDSIHPDQDEVTAVLTQKDYPAVARILGDQKSDAARSLEEEIKKYRRKIYDLSSAVMAQIEGGKIMGSFVSGSMFFGIILLGAGMMMLQNSDNYQRRLETIRSRRYDYSSEDIQTLNTIAGELVAQLFAIPSFPEAVSALGIDQNIQEQTLLNLPESTLKPLAVLIKENSPEAAEIFLQI